MKTGKQSYYRPLMYINLVKDVMDGKLTLAEVKNILGESNYKDWVENYYQGAMDIKELSNRCRLMIMLKTSEQDLAKTFIELQKKRLAFLKNVTDSLENTIENQSLARVTAVNLVNKAVENAFTIVEDKGLDYAMTVANDPRIGTGYVRDILLNTIEFQKSKIQLDYYKKLLGDEE